MKVAWEHLPCGTIHPDQRNPPLECGFCSGLLVRVTKGRQQGWRRVSASIAVPKSRQRRAAKARTGPFGTKRRSISPNRRQALYERDDFACVSCGSGENLTLDHKVPLSKGGDNSDENLQTMCRDCNNEKGDA